MVGVGVRPDKYTQSFKHSPSPGQLYFDTLSDSNKLFLKLIFTSLQARVSLFLFLFYRQNENALHASA